MEATLTDVHGPGRWRVLGLVLPIVMVLVAIFGRLGGTASGVLGLSGFVLFNLAAAIGIRRQTPRRVELRCGPGYVDVRRAGTRNQRLRAADVTGATTARRGAAVLLTVQFRERHQPLTFQVASEREAEELRRALGIGHHGFGTVCWRTKAPNGPFVGGLVAAISTIVATLLVVIFGSKVALPLVPMFAMTALAGAVFVVGGLLGQRDQTGIMMTAEGLRLYTPRGWFTLPYHLVDQIRAKAGAVTFDVPAPYNSIAVERTAAVAGGLSSDELETAIAQIHSAAARARGEGPHKNDVTGRVDVLRRTSESARDWLGRLDMAGQMLSSGGPGYRGNTLDAEDLWAVLEDPEADAELRAAAARVLRHAPAPETKVRIDAAVSAVRDETVVRRLRIATTDSLDEASEELAALEASELAPAVTVIRR